MHHVDGGAAYHGDVSKKVVLADDELVEFHQFQNGEESDDDFRLSRCGFEKGIETERFAGFKMIEEKFDLIGDRKAIIHDVAEVMGFFKAFENVLKRSDEIEDGNFRESSRFFFRFVCGIGLEGETALLIHQKGPRRVSPFFIPGALINLVSGQVSIKYGFKGPNHSVVTACSTGAHAIGDASRLIMFGDADVMVAGGAESSICEIGIAGFNACKALSTKSEADPTKASRPYDRDRDGFVMGEGAGVVVLEELEHAKARGAKIYAEVLGYGMSGDAYHITAPSETGEGGERSMRAALKNAGLEPSAIDYINAHGTSSMADTIELSAVERLLGDAASGVTMSSTKSSTGHLLGAAGAIEAIFSILAIRDQVAPPTINLDNPAVQTPIDLAPNAKVERQINVALSNSFGFGGTNASVVFGKFA